MATRPHHTFGRYVLNRSARSVSFSVGGSLLFLFAVSVHAAGMVGPQNDLQNLERIEFGQYTVKPDSKAPVSNEGGPTMNKDELASVAPALEKHSQTTLADLWKRPGLSPRDRSLGTVA